MFRGSWIDRRGRAISSSLLIVSLIVLGWAPLAGASIVVSPARIEMEVGPAGTRAQLMIANRGPYPVELNLYVGYGTQSESGAPIYLDDKASREHAASWVKPSKESVVLPPGEATEVAVDVTTVPGYVAAYPVLYVEEVGGDSDRQPPGLRNRLRIAVPFLVTFSAMKHRQQFKPYLHSVSARTLSDSDRMLVDVEIENQGTLHGAVMTRLAALSVDGRILQEIELDSGRMLPGVTRRIGHEFRRSGLPDEVRFVASIVGDGTPSQFDGLVRSVAPGYRAEIYVEGDCQQCGI